MKKSLLFLIFVLGVAVNVNATKTRLYIYMVKNWVDYSGGTKIYTWDKAGEYTGNYNSNDNKMVQISGTNWYYIDAEFPDTINMILISGNGDSWKSANIEGVNIKNKYLKFSSDTNGSVFTYEAKDMGYYLYKVDGTTTAMSSDDGNTYTCTLDNQTSTTNDEYLIAPKFAIDDYSSSDARWNMMFRPWQQNQTLSFANQTDYYYYGIYYNNTNSWKLNNVSAHFTFTFNVTNWTYCVEPYVEKKINVEYATFSHTEATAVPSGVEVYAASSATSSAVTLTKQEVEKIPASTGVIIKGEAGTYKFTPATGEATIGTNLLQPSGDVTTADYIYGRKDGVYGFYHPSAGGTLGKNLAFLPGSAVPTTEAKLSVIFEDGTTAIESIETSNEPAAYYNLQGIRVEKPIRGIYVVNGKKVVVK